MLDVNSPRKNKITLSDYPYQKDIENRLLMAHFSDIDLEVMEEIIYSSLSIPVKKLAKSVDLEEDELFPILEKFSKTGLLSYNQDLITVDKDMRKYYEAQILKFDEEYEPGMELLQSLLKKVPIQALPLWYAIPRTSNNIFESLVEKYLLTPQIFRRYLMEIQFPDPILHSILKEVYESDELKIFSSTLIEKYNLSREKFEEYLLLLEFNFVCCLGYEKVNNTWKEIVTPFHEWREYLQFLKNTETPSAKNTLEAPRPFSFIQDMSTLLQLMKKSPLEVSISQKTDVQLEPETYKMLLSKCPGIDENYIKHLIAKLRLLKLADIIDGRLYALDAANDWLDMPLENRALCIYRHPLNRILSYAFPSHLFTEKNIREAEKSIIRVLTKGWVLFDDFIKGVLAPLNEGSSIMLKKGGRTWKYTLPEYTDEEKSFIKAIIFEWLFEAGMVAKGEIDGKPAFLVTPFGQSFFGR